MRNEPSAEAPLGTITVGTRTKLTDRRVDVESPGLAETQLKVPTQTEYCLFEFECTGPCLTDLYVPLNL